MESNDGNNRNASTEEMFAMEGQGSRKLKDEDELYAQSVTDQEELSLQNIFIDKGEQEAMPVNGVGGSEREEADSLADSRDGQQAEPPSYSRSEEAVGAASSHAEVAPQSIQLVEEALINSSGLDFTSRASIANLAIDPDLGTVEQVEPGEWVFTPAPGVNAESIPVQLIISDAGGTTEVQVPVDPTVNEPGEPQAPQETAAPNETNERNEPAEPREPLEPSEPNIPTGPKEPPEPVAPPAANEAPSVGTVTLEATHEDTAKTFSSEELLSGSTDADGDPLTVVSVDIDEQFGSLTDNGDGTWTFLPTENFHAEDIPVTFTVSDGDSETVGSATLDVTAVNDEPVVNHVDLGVTVEDNAITFQSADLLANSADIDGDDLSVTAVSVDAEFGEITDNGDGSWTFNPTENYNGDDVPVSFSVSDGTAEASSAATLDVAAVNDGPVVKPVDLGTTSEDTAVTFSSTDLLANASDIEGDDLSVTAVSVDAEFGEITDNGDGSWTFNPTEDYNGDDVPVSFSVSDGTAEASSAATLDVAAVNDGPVVKPVDLGTTSEDTAVTFSSTDLLANASDIEGDDLSVTAVSVDAEFGEITDNGDGSWTFNPTEDYNGDDVPVSFSVSDGTAEASSAATLDVAAVNDGPVVKPVDLGTTSEDTAVTFSSTDLLANASDIDGDDLSVTAVSVNAEFGEITDNGDGSWTFNPTENYNGDNVPVSFTVTDGSSHVSSAATLDVSAVNDGPVVNSVELGEIEQGSTISFSAEELLANASDIDGDALTITDVSVDPAYGSIENNGDGTWTFAPSEEFSGENIPLNFTVSDGTDTAQASAAVDIKESGVTVEGTRGSDVLVGGGGDDTFTVYGNGGLDQYDGGGGNDSIVGSRYNDTIQVSDNLDNIQNIETIDGGAGYDTLQAGSGNDTIDLSSAPELRNIEEIDGGRGDDTIIGTAGNDTIEGNLGNDTLSGGGGDDTFKVYGNAGLDQYDGGGGNDSIVGSRYNDTIQVSDNLDNIQNIETIDGGAGYDTLQAGSGNDTIDLSSAPELRNIEEIDGGRGDDTIIGTAGNDTIEGNLGNDTLSGGGGDDTFKVYGNAGLDQYDGGGGNDSIVGSRYNDTIQVSDNLDNIQNIETIDGGAGYDTLQAGSGNDTIDLSSAPELRNIEEIDGGRGDDTIIGTAGNDTIEGNLGNDTLSGGGGDDTFKVYGNAGLDQYDGGGGNDSIVGSRYNDTIQVSDNLDNIQNIETIDGGAGYDTLQAGSGNDTIDLSSAPELRNIEEIDGGRGDDTIIGTAGNDTIEGNLGNDTLSGGGGDDTFKVYGNAGLDQYDGGGGNDSIVGSRYNDTIQVSDNLDNIQNIETIDGGAGYDTLQAGSGNDTIDLSSAPELRNIEEIDGGRGDDTIIGTAGNDTIEGNLGNDTLSGGGGDDTFKVYGNAGLDQYDGGGGNDSIVGSRYNDTIQVSDNLDNIQNIETIDGGAGYDTLQAGSGNDTIDLSNGPALQNIEEIDGGYGDDTIIGTAGNDTIDGNRGDDTLSGGGGDDALSGGSGTDTLVLTGNRADYNVVNNGDSTFTITDTVADRDGEDTIDGFEHIEFADSIMTMDEALIEPEPSALAADSDLMFALSTDEASTGWAEEIDTEKVDSEAMTDWDNTAALDEMELAASALDLEPDTNGVVAMTEGSDVDSLATLHDSANY